MTLALVTLCTTAFIVMVGFIWKFASTWFTDTPITHTVRMTRREPEVIVFTEPVFRERRRGKEAAKEREKYLVRLNDQIAVCW